MAEHFCPHTPVRPTGRVRQQVLGSPVRCFNRRICMDAEWPVTNQTGFTCRRPLKLCRLPVRTFGWTSTTPKRTCRRNCVLCACTACCVRSAVQCIVYFVVCTLHRAHLHCATVLWLMYDAQRDNEGTTRRQAGEPSSRLKT